jgi:DNA polymerase III epsilon subunit-like protein
MLSFAVKWQGERRVRTHALPDYSSFRRDKENDKALVLDFWRVLNEADIVIAHNGDAFDLKKGNARFIQHGLKPPAPYKTIDTLKIARSKFKFDSNRLDDLGNALGVGRKLPHTGKHLWFGCMAGQAAAWRKMRRYNARDVELLERVYEKIKPWATNHPNLNLYSGKGGCPTCQEPTMQRRGRLATKTTVRQRFQCMSCGSWFAGEIVR